MCIYALKFGLIVFIFNGKLNRTNVGNICLWKKPSHQGFEKRSSKYAKKIDNQATMHHPYLLKMYPFSSKDQKSDWFERDKKYLP